MIGVIADTAEYDVISEFFELFKTPWEFCQSGRRYDVLLCTGDRNFDAIAAKLVLIYAGKTVISGATEEGANSFGKTNRMLLHNGKRIPIYGDSQVFEGETQGLLLDEESRHVATYERQSPNRMVIRLGYDLFREVYILLTEGQPAANAEIPTLDLHIALLRNLIVENGIPLVEIPPVPDGHEFITCLTHDVDHPSIRAHRWDHTILGFLHRAVFGSVVNVLRGRSTIRELCTNWLAALRLPAVYLGLAKDFWIGFDSSYLEVEEGLSSTFFVIPFSDNPGRSSNGAAPSFRAARYGVRDIAPIVRRLLAAGCEVALHGIDAWMDSATGREELDEIRQITGISEIGVRMHWLYYDRQSPAMLDDAGAIYDSTMGYRETVGYRAGTTQVYKPLGTSRLLELPMHVMDTALFYPAYMGLSQRQAKGVLGRVTDTVSYLGGCLTINWHDRSLAPERLWRECYCELVQNLKDRNTWFATASQAVSWFRKRRSVVFEADGFDADSVRARIAVEHNDNVPGLRLRIYNADETREDSIHRKGYVDIPFHESMNSRACCAVG